MNLLSKQIEFSLTRRISITIKDPASLKSFDMYQIDQSALELFLRLLIVVAEIGGSITEHHYCWDQNPQIKPILAFACVCFFFLL